MQFKPCLLADFGATNARLSITTDGKNYQKELNLKIENYSSIEILFKDYFATLDLPISRAVIGVAAPVISDEIRFINCDFQFSIKKLKNAIFMDGLEVLNDLALQAHGLEGLSETDFETIGQLKKPLSGPKILVAPGTGLGMAAIVEGKVISTEAGHLNIPAKVSKDGLNDCIKAFIEIKKRHPTFEDFLSGKGLNFFYSILTNQECRLSNEEILNNYKTDSFCLEVKELMNYLYASYLRYMALALGSVGGVYITGSISESLFLNIDKDKFRLDFEDSETMGVMLQATPLYRITLKDLGFKGALKLSNLVSC